MEFVRMQKSVRAFLHNLLWVSEHMDHRHFTYACHRQVFGRNDSALLHRFSTLKNTAPTQQVFCRSGNSS